jgi:flagellar L-ring protein FlgH
VSFTAILLWVVVARADEVQAPGSLWSEPAARALTGMDGNARRVGDLITVVISESTQTEVTADTATQRESSAGLSVGALFGLEKTLGKRASLALDAGSDASFTGSGETRAGNAVEGRLTCEVVEVLANGNLVITGFKTVQSNGEAQLVTVEGIVRPRDIRMDNTVESGLLAQANIKVGGDGVVSDKQTPGVGQRLMDHTLPF